jgi:hypothetical protein
MQDYTRRNYMSDIPPEGDEYNKEREEQLYAGITNRTMLQRRYAEMVAASAPPEQIHECLSAIAQTDRDIARLSLELHNSTQGRNLNIFMTRMEVALKEHESNNTLILSGVNNSLTLLNLTVEKVLTTARQALTVAKAGAARLGKLEERMSASEADRHQINDRLARIEAIMSARPSQRTQEYQQVADEVIRQLEARGDGER